MKTKAKTIAMQYLQIRFLIQTSYKLRELASQGYVLFADDALDMNCISNYMPTIMYSCYIPDLDKNIVVELTKNELESFLDDVVEQYTKVKPEEANDCRKALSDVKKALDIRFPDKKAES